MTKARHFDIGECVLQVHVPRPRRWAPSYREWRFLLLGPRPAERGFRPTLAAGDIVDGKPVLTYGAASTEQLQSIEALAL